MNSKPLEAFSKAAEEAVVKYWSENGIPEKARSQHKSSKKKFYLMDGPPYATGNIHMGTALNKIQKDIAMRAKRMQGFDVFDRPGYDTHGVPIEYKIEQKHGFRSKDDIEKFGVENFISECRSFASEFIPVMSKQFEDLGVWMDWKNPYITFTNEYIEGVWWTFKKANEKGLLYLGKYSMHVCPRCETVVSYNEIEYIKQTDLSVYVKFPVVGAKNKFLVIWTTTPWTLPANTGVMVHPKFTYVEATVGAETWIVAKERLQPLMEAIEAGYTISKELLGKELEGIRYENPLIKNLKLGKLENAFRVVLSDRYVNVEDGTGLVHTAPGHGKEDFEVGQKTGLPALSPIGLDGILTAEAGKYAGKKARVVDSEIIEDLEQMGFLVYKHPYTHDYPVCWRDKSPLLMMSIPQWFFRISKFQSKLLSENDSVNWVPSRMKSRMQNWLEGLSDWPVSRSRYWGTPLPIWVCDKCNSTTVVGSVAELGKLTSLPKNLDLHKPWIDRITLNCKCGGVSKRVPHVLDVWFDSGVSSWAALDFLSNPKQLKQFWPADVNIEGTDQFRGWWNSQLICSVICFDEKPFKSIGVHGLVLDIGKKKMSKSHGNAVLPSEVIEKHSRDFLRFYLGRESKGDDFLFDWEAFTDIGRFFAILWNSYNYAALYLNLDFKQNEFAPAGKLEVEDQWLVSKTHSLIQECVSAYNSYEFARSADAIESFVVSDLSRTYIKLIRDRAKEDPKAVSQVMSFALYSVLRLLAPLAPHISEHFFLHAKKTGLPESVHLAGFPELDSKRIDLKLETEFVKSQEVLQAVLALREEQKKKLRWPLSKLVVVTKTGKEFSRVLPLIATQANVEIVSESSAGPKSGLVEKAGNGFSVFLDVSADALREDLWEFEELRRLVQEERKKAKLLPGTLVELEFACSDAAFSKKFGSRLEKETLVKLVPGKGTQAKLLNKSFFIRLKAK